MKNILAEINELIIKIAKANWVEGEQYWSFTKGDLTASVQIQPDTRGYFWNVEGHQGNSLEKGFAKSLQEAKKDAEKAMGSDLDSKIINSAQAYNNTIAWKHGNSVFVDSLKDPKIFLDIMKNEYGIKGQVRHIERINKAVLTGEESTNHVFGGRKTNCNVIEFPLNKE